MLGQNPASPPRDTTASLPETSFESFWQTFEDYYAFFALRNIDWKAAYHEYRPLIHAATSDDSLFAVLSAMLAPFQGDHINIIIPQKRQFTAEKTSHFLKAFNDEPPRSAFWKMVDQTLQKPGFGNPQTA